jgi:hypothetical protein
MVTFSVSSQGIMGEKNNFNRQDTLRGSITKERIWWDLTYYHLDIKIDPENRTIIGSNEISYTVIDTYYEMQIDLQEPLVLTKAQQNGEDLQIRHDGDRKSVV